MPLLFRNVRGSNRKIALQQLNSIVRKEIEKTLDKEVKPTLVKSHEVIVKNWKHKPKFQAKKTIKPDVIAVTVFPTGENKKIWRFVDKGTKPHVIKAKNAPNLIFQTGYKPKTLASPARTVSGGGKSIGPIVSKKQVNHPGSKARKFTETIAKDIKPDFKRVIENAFRRSANKTKE